MELDAGNAGEVNRDGREMGNAGSPFELPKSEQWAQFENLLKEAEDAKKEDEKLAAMRMERLKPVLERFQSNGWKGPEDIKKEMMSEGIEKGWQIRQLATSNYRDRNAADEERDFQADLQEFGDEKARELENEREEIANGLEWAREQPLWQQLSGLDPKREMGMHPGKRAACIRKLMKWVENWVRWEVRNGQKAEGYRQKAEGGMQKAEGNGQKAEGGMQEAEGNGQKAEGGMQKVEGNGQKAEGGMQKAEGNRQKAEGGMQEAEGNRRKAEGDGRKTEGGLQKDWDGQEVDEPRVDATRQYSTWDPLRAVCFSLGIAQRKLSAFCREVNGLSAIQLCDAIKAEALKKVWRKRVREALTSLGDAVKGVGDGLKLRERAFAVWRLVKAERQRTGSHRSSFAWGMGFSSYSRMFRACLVCYELAPQDLEVLLIEEWLGEGARCVPGQAELSGAERERIRFEDVETQRNEGHEPH